MPPIDPSDKPLMADAIAREVLYQTRYDAKVADLVNALRGIASCGTACGCCQMHNEIAREALERWARLSAGAIRG